MWFLSSDRLTVRRLTNVNTDCLKDAPFGQSHSPPYPNFRPGTRLSVIDRICRSATPSSVRHSPGTPGRAGEKRRPATTGKGRAEVSVRPVHRWMDRSPSSSSRSGWASFRGREQASVHQVRHEHLEAADSRRLPDSDRKPAADSGVSARTSGTRRS